VTQIGTEPALGADGHAGAHGLDHDAVHAGPVNAPVVHAVAVVGLEGVAGPGVVDANLPAETVHGAADLGEETLVPARVELAPLVAVKVPDVVSPGPSRRRSGGPALDGNGSSTPIISTNCPTMSSE